MQYMPVLRLLNSLVCFARSFCIHQIEFVLEDDDDLRAIDQLQGAMI
jgi:hypothetical protein